MIPTSRLYTSLAIPYLAAMPLSSAYLENAVIKEENSLTSCWTCLAWSWYISVLALHLPCEAREATSAFVTSFATCLYRNLVENIFSRTVYEEYQRRWDAVQGKPWRQGMVPEYFFWGITSYNKTRSAFQAAQRMILLTVQSIFRNL